MLLRPFTRQKNLGPDPPKKAVRTHNFCKEILESPQGHRRLWPCGNSNISLQKLWVRTTFLTGPGPIFSVVETRLLLTNNNGAADFRELAIPGNEIVFVQRMLVEGGGRGCGGGIAFGRYFLVTFAQSITFESIVLQFA